VVKRRPKARGLRARKRGGPRRKRSWKWKRRKGKRRKGRR